jgi:hypothetical protein
MENTPTRVAYKTLSSSLKRQGYLYKQLCRKGRWAIYEQYSKQPEKLVAYEVVKIGKHNGFSIAGLFFPPAETYPASSMWGARGWTYSKLEEAQKSFCAKCENDCPTEVDDVIDDKSILKEMFREAEGDPSGL